MQDKTNDIASKYLGKKVDGSESYNPAFLVAVPREDNRQHYQIDSKQLPFVGWDVWHAYEFSAMTENGVPVTRLMKLNYNCDNDFIVESKSLKLYLNSFNMTRYGQTVAECLEICKKIIEKDLSEKLQTVVTVNFIENNAPRVEIYSEFKNILDYVDEKSITIDKFKEAPELLQVQYEGEIKEHYLTFDSLRSNCRVTHQPDFGDVFICYKSRKHIQEVGLLKYLCSFRTEYHFHEECCEMIYKRLFDILDENDELFVSILYTRRGGIDISPSRWSKNCDLADVQKLIDVKTYARKSIKQ